MSSKQRDRGPPVGAVRSHGKHGGLPDGFRWCETGHPARPSGQQATPLRGALRVNKLSTAAGLRLENDKAVFHTAPCEKPISSSIC